VDDNRFDAVSKRLGEVQLTRGHVLRGVVGAAVAAVAGAVVSSSEADAKKKHKARKKAKHAKADRSKSKQQTADTTDTTCRTSGHPCEGGQTCCQGLTCLTESEPGTAERCSSGRCTKDSDCLPGEVCENGLCIVKPCSTNEDCPDGSICVEGVCVPVTPCGALNETCCAGNPKCDSADLTCVNNTCVPVTPPCGALNEVCCAGNPKCDSADLTCVNNTCVLTPPVECGGLNETCCANEPRCDVGTTCVNNTCVLTPAAPCTDSTQCPAGSVCNTTTGQCIVLGLVCKSGETAQQCCIRSVKKGCKRKQQSAHARKTCLKRGKRRCNSLLGGV